MRDWHVKHMQDIIVKYLTGLSEDASRWQRRLDKQYENLAQVTKRIDYDLKHGVEKQEVLSFLNLIKTDQSYSELRKANDFGYRLDSLEASFLNNETKQIILCHSQTIRILDSETARTYQQGMYIQDSK
jgi:hypothetical protein